MVVLVAEVRHERRMRLSTVLLLATLAWRAQATLYFVDQPYDFTAAVDPLLGATWIDRYYDYRPLPFGLFAHPRRALLVLPRNDEEARHFARRFRPVRRVRLQVEIVRWGFLRDADSYQPTFERGLTYGFDTENPEEREALKSIWMPLMRHPWDWLRMNFHHSHYSHAATRFSRVENRETGFYLEMVVTLSDPSYPRRPLMRHRIVDFVRSTNGSALPRSLCAEGLAGE